MEKVIIKNIKTYVTKEVAKEIASDYLGTKEWEIVKDFQKNKVDEQINKYEYKKYKVKEDK